MNVTPGRWADKTEDEKKLYSLDLQNAIAPTEVIASAEWLSEPAGLSFEAPTINGKIVQVMIGGGVKGQSYRVRVKLTLQSTGEVLEPSVNDQPGVPMQVLGNPTEDVPAYRWN